MFLVGGIPRSGTTVIAGFLSLDESLYCYASETHLFSFLHHHFEFYPCPQNRIDAVIAELRKHLVTSLIDVPRDSIQRKYGHTGYALIKQQHIDFMLDELSNGFKQGLYGERLFALALKILDQVLTTISTRKHRGEKTPDNLFPIAAYSQHVPVTNFVVAREPFGTLRSMTDRIQLSLPHSEIFKGNIEHKIGIYLHFAEAAIKALQHDCSHRVGFEEFALDPRASVEKLYAVFNLTPAQDVLQLAEQGGMQEVADRAPMKYRRVLKVQTDLSMFSAVEQCKIYALTQHIRDALGYSNETLRELGFKIHTEWPGGSVNSELIAMSGFHNADVKNADGLDGRWSNGNSRIIAYVQNRRSARITLNILTNYPNSLLDHGPLTITTVTGGTIKHTLQAGAGLQTHTISFQLDPDEMNTIGNGTYQFIDISASRSFCPMFTEVNSADIRRLAFQVVNWSIKA